jgi:serine/threonine-protein kinase
MQMIKVLDFGISKIALPRGKRDLVRTQMALGSPVYMSPEQIRRSDQVDARSDIWAVGCVLFELLTGVTAFDEPSLLELSAAILEREPVPLQTLRPDASEELEQVVLRCLTKDPADRFQNVAELAAALYPFGPRRARISAERCYHMLKNAGIVANELTLASAFPPALQSGRVTTGALKARPSRTVTTPALDIFVDDDDEVTRLAKPRRRSTPIIVGLSIAAAAAGFVALRARGPEPTAASATAPAPRAAEPASRDGATRPAAVPDPDAAPAVATPSASAAARTAPTKPSTAPKAAKAPRPVRAPAAAGKRPRGSDDELDPGF